MAISITLTTNNRFKIDDGTRIQYWPSAEVYIANDGYDYVVMNIPSGAGGVKVLKALASDITSPADTSVGNATFDFTGGAQEDLWTLATHGFEVGDRVRFSAKGTGAPEYDTGVNYFVVTVPTVNTFQLSLTAGGAVLEGTADSVGTWTIKHYSAEDKAESIEAL